MSIPQRPGIAGLGIIGQRVADRLREHGLAPAVWSRTARPKEPGWVKKPAALVKACDVVQIFVTDGKALLNVLRHMKPELAAGKIIINCSTVALPDTEEAEKLVTETGAAYLDAPFTGSRDAAASGQLTYYVGGDAEVLAQVRPLLALSSKEIFHCGPSGSATVLKIATNMVSATTVAILAEAMAVVAGQGIALAKFQRALELNAAASGVSRMKIASMIAGDFTPHFSLKNMLKDASFGLQLGGEAGVQLPILNTVAEGMAEMAGNGHGEQDYSVMIANYLPLRE